MYAPAGLKKSSSWARSSLCPQLFPHGRSSLCLQLFPHGRSSLCLRLFSHGCPSLCLRLLCVSTVSLPVSQSKTARPELNILGHWTSHIQSVFFFLVCSSLDHLKRNNLGDVHPRSEADTSKRNQGYVSMWFSCVGKCGIRFLQNCF